MADIHHVTMSGPKGKTIFHDTYMACLADDTRLYLAKKTQERIDHTNKVKDIPAIVVVNSLIIENNIDDIIESLMPDYKILKNNTNFTFSMKIDILKALKVIPNFILNSCDIIRKIRNEFAHNLEIDDFDKLDKPLIKKMDGQLKNFDKKTNMEQPILDRYNELNFFTSWALQTYKTHTQRLNEYIRDDNFIKKFQDFCIKEKDGFYPNKQL